MEYFYKYDCRFNFNLIVSPLSLCVCVCVCVCVIMYTHTLSLSLSLFLSFVGVTGNRPAHDHFLHKMKSPAQTREQSLEENTLGLQSPLLKTAKDFLENSQFFGIFDRMPESYELFNHGFCLPSRPDLLPVEHAHSKREVPEGLREVFEKYNPLDQMLYTYAVELFEERVHVMNRDRQRGVKCRHAGCGIKCS